MKTTRTIIIQLDIDPDLIRPLIAEYLKVCNHISDIAFENKETNFYELHRLSYALCRSLYPLLPSQMVSNALRDVSQTYTRWKKGKLPDKALSFKNFSVPLSYGRDYRFRELNTLDIKTLEGRKTGIKYKIGIHFQKYLDWDLGGGQLYIRNNKVFLSFAASKEMYPDAQEKDVLGVDRGIIYTAVATNGKKISFIPGSRIQHHRNLYTQRRKQIDQAKAQKWTRSKEKVQQRLADREKRYIRDCQHVISKKLVQLAKKWKCGTIALEDLKDIYLESNAQWIVNDLERFLGYKALNRGLKIIKVNPKYTSQICSKCGHLSKENRKGLTFQCTSCGYTVHSDANAALNIRKKAIYDR